MKRLEIKPENIGELKWARQNGMNAVICFDYHGYAWAELPVNTLEPVHKADGTWLNKPEYKGLVCIYNAARKTLENFHQKPII